MTGDWQIHILDSAIEEVMEKFPADMEEPGCESRQKGTDASKNQILGTVALPADGGLEHRNRKADSRRREHRDEAHPRPGDLGSNKHPAGLHGGPTISELAMGTSRV